MFFIGYFLFEVPSNLLLERVGARRWIARVMISWGILPRALPSSGSQTSFYVLRFLLGVAEAGFFPGMILYLTYWFPKRYRGRVTAGFMTAIPIASFIARRSPASCSSSTAWASRAGNGCSSSRACRRCCSASWCSAS